jgi:hypothetical protein
MHWVPASEAQYWNRLQCVLRNRARLWREATLVVDAVHQRCVTAVGMLMLFTSAASISSITITVDQAGIMRSNCLRSRCYAEARS